MLQPGDPEASAALQHYQNIKGSIGKHNSSPSHAVFLIVVHTNGITSIHGKFSLIDLASNKVSAIDHVMLL
jgi:hypothetical protein